MADNTTSTSSYSPLPEPGLDAATLASYLDRNPAFLETYIRQRWTLEKLDRLRRQLSLTATSPNPNPNEGANEQSHSNLNNYVCVNTRAFSNGTLTGRPDSAGTDGFLAKKLPEGDHVDFIHDLAKKFHGRVGKENVLFELAQQICKLIDADGVKLYMVNASGNKIYPFDGEMVNTVAPGQQNGQLAGVTANDSISAFLIGEGSTIAAFVASRRESLRIDDLQPGDSRFPDGIFPTAAGDRVGEGKDLVHSVIAYPVLVNDELVGVLAAYRIVGRLPFTLYHEMLFSSLLAWGAITVGYIQHYGELYRQREMNEFVLKVTKYIFQDMISMDSVIKKIMSYARTLVNADRASLFLVDSKSNELYASIFDVGNKNATDGLDTFIEASEIRFPISKGIAGFVATKRKTLNIHNAYENEYFNKDIDIQTGYTTRSILCMPITIHGEVIGVVQMVNKLDGVFTEADEKAFEMFSVYCGLALHNAKLYEEIQSSEQKYKVAVDVLSYHRAPNEDECQRFLSAQSLTEEQTIKKLRFDYNQWQIDPDEKAHLVIYMLQDVIGNFNVDYKMLVRFTLTVRKNYRNVPYHNWTHAFTVAQTMYMIIKRAKEAISPFEAIALLVSCLCHDIDHRGRNNSFMVKRASPLAELYSTSTMEQHHFNYTVSIIQEESMSVFKFLSSEDYKHMLDTIRHCILSTDLELYFQNKKQLRELLDCGSFNWAQPDHRKLVQAVSMTAADLSANAKPWEAHQSTVQNVIEEFYAQGDEEKRAGLVPMKMMDRQYSQELPELQVGFIKAICVPCYELVAALLPEAHLLLEGSKNNLLKWSGLAEENKLKKEQTWH